MPGSWPGAWNDDEKPEPRKAQNSSGCATVPITRCGWRRKRVNSRTASAKATRIIGRTPHPVPLPQGERGRAPQSELPLPSVGEGWGEGASASLRGLARRSGRGGAIALGQMDEHVFQGRLTDRDARDLGAEA